jgi:hypothetical protein
MPPTVNGSLINRKTRNVKESRRSSQDKQSENKYVRSVMAKRGSQSPDKQRRGIAGTPNYLDSISPTDALQILKLMAQRDVEIRKKIDAAAREVLTDIDKDAVASEVQMELEFLNVEEVWDRAGSTRDGYVEPGDAAWELVEEALHPFMEELAKYKKLSMIKEADLLSMGIMKGIYQFSKESTTEFKDWAVGAPEEYFGRVLDEWKKGSLGRNKVRKMEAFIRTHCPDWAHWAIKSLKSSGE